MGIESIGNGDYGVFQYSNEYGKECLFSGTLSECFEFMYYNL